MPTPDRYPSMGADLDPVSYDAWYQTSRGRWIGEVEFALLMQLLRPAPGETLLDAGCGSGYFSRRFAGAGLVVTGLDPDGHMLDYSRTQGNGIEYLRGDVLALPFDNRTFDHCIAVTSLCFVADPVLALREMLRVARHGVVLGLLNRHSLLYRQKHGRGSYRGARWDSVDDVRRWFTELSRNLRPEIRSAVFFSQGGPLARLAETCLPTRWLWGGFLAIGLYHPIRQEADHHETL